MSKPRNGETRSKFLLERKLLKFLRFFKAKTYEMSKSNKLNIEELQRKIFYSDKYYDDQYEYRHVVLPHEMVKLVPRTHLMEEDEWRSIGVQQSRGWVHYMIHAPEPNILLFRRPLSYSQENNENQ